MDLFIAGQKENGDVISKVYDNLEGIENPNLPPNPPYGLNDDSIDDNQVLLQWNRPIDPDIFGATSEQSLRFQIQIGSDEENNEHGISSGKYDISEIGTTNLNRKLVQNLSEGNYSWRVRAIDNGLSASNWSNTEYFYIDVTPPVLDTVRANYVSDDQGLNWLEIDTGYFGSFWSGVKVDNGQSLLLGMSGNLTLATLVDVDLDANADKEIYVACYESGLFRDECKMYVFDNLFIGTKNSLTNAIVLDDGRIAISGNGGAISIVDLHRNRDIQTCVRADRLSNTSIIQLSNDEFLLAGEKGVRKHSMNECLNNFTNKESNSQDSYYTISLD